MCFACRTTPDNRESAREESRLPIEYCDRPEGWPEPATWPNGSGNGLQSRVFGFDSRRRLQPLTSYNAWSGVLFVVTNIDRHHRQIAATVRVTSMTVTDLFGVGPSTRRGLDRQTADILPKPRPY